MAQASWSGFQKNLTRNYVTRSPEAFDAGKHVGEEPRGLLGSVWDNVAGGMESMVGSAMDTAGTMLKAQYEDGRASRLAGLAGKYLVDRAIDLNQLAAENARRSGVRNEYSDMGIFDRLTSPSYLLDPRGFTAEVSNMTGSMIPFMLMSAVMPEVGAGTAAGLIGGGLSRFGVKKAAELFKPGGAGAEFLRDFSRWAPTGVVDAAANAGEVAEEMRRQGYTSSQISNHIGSAMSYELPYDIVSNGLFGGFLGGKGVRKLAEGGSVRRNIAANAALGGLEALNEAGQEFVQTQAVEQALGKPVGTFMNPTDDERKAFDAAFIGTLPMVAAGGARNVTKNWLRGKAESGQSELQSSAPVKTSGNENIDALIAQAAEKYGIPVNLLHSIAQTESAYNQDARSEAGAIGMMQLMPDTAAGLGVDPNDLAGNIEGGAKYMRELLDTFDGDVEKAVAAYNAGPNAVKKHGGIPPFVETQDYVRKVLGGLDDYDTSVPQRMRNLADDAAPYIGVTMDNGENGCVEAVTKIGAKSCPFLAQELENGVVNVDRLVEHAGDRVIPFDPNSLEEGDVIVYGDKSDPQRHVVLYDGKGGYIGNSTQQNKVVQGSDYNEMGDWTPTKIIKTGAQFGSRGMRSVVAPVIPDFTGLIADEKNIAVTQEAIQNLINTDRLTTAQHAAILQAAEMIRDMPVGDGTDAAADAEHVNEWQSLIDRKDIKGIFEKDPQKVVQTMTNLGKEQRAQKTRAAIENQQKIEETKQAIAAVQTQANTQPVQAAPMQGDQSVQQIVPDQVEQMGTPDQPENVMQMPQEAHPVSDAFAAGLQSGAADAVQTAQPEQPRTPVSQEELAGILSKVQQWEQPLLSVPEYVTARNRQDWAATAQIARAANVPGVAQFYDTLMEHGSRNATNITPYAPQQEAPHAPQQSAPPIAVPSAKAPVPAVGVRPNVPTRLPDNIEERRALGRSLGRFMTDNKINIPKQLGYDLAGGRGKAIQAANDKITAWEEKRAEQEADVNTSHTAQEDAQSAQNTIDDRMLAQRGERAQNGSGSVREKSAQNQGNKKAADEGDKELADGYETESGRPLSEADPKEFIIKPNGSRNFGEITKAVSDAVMQQSGVSLVMGDIRLRVGNEIEGLIHAKAHTAEAKQAGYSSVEELIADVAQNFNQIYMRAPDNVNGKPTYSLVKTGNKKAGIMNGVAPVYFELQSDDGGNYYIVVTAMPKGDTQLARQTKRDRLIYSSPGLGAATISGNGAVSHDGKAGAANRGGSPTSDKSGGLSTSTIPSEAEESKEKTLNEGEREAVKGLSADAKNVYQLVRDKLSGMKNKKVARAASAGAVLLARHADIIARKVRATLGTPFTAMDYYRSWFALQYGDAEKPYGGFTQKQVESQKDAVRKQYEGTAQWMKAPNGEETNLTEDQWLAVRTPAFKAWFGDWETDSTASSKVLDDNGEPKIVYHGTKRKDRIGSVFRKERATSGPMAFFTDLYDIAENYSRNKQDTSIDNPPYEEQFRIKNLYGDMPLHVKWRALSPAKQQEITEKASHVTQDDDGNIVYDEDIDYGIGNFKHEIKEFRGNAIRALEEGWLNGGTLFGDEGRFLEVLKLAGVDGKEFEGVFFDDPNATDEGVFRVFMDMKKPFDTSKDITKSFMRSLRAAAKKAPKQEYEQGIDFWDKRAISPMEFVERVEHDLENGTTHAWTAIPDWVTMLLRKKGYNGIRDTGGKNGGAEHIVYIPFESNQIKSVDNNGAFSPDDVNIFHQSAWHGTPHDFDGFDIGAIGTGEGAQVHGWGLYFAQDRKVSEGYKEWLAGKHISYDGKPISAYTGDIHQALTALEKRIQPNFTEDIPTQIIAYRNELAQNVRRARVLLSAIDVELAKDEDSPPATLAALRKDASARIREIIDSAPPLHNGGRRKVADVMQYLRNEQERQRRFIRNAEVLGQQLQHIDSSKVGAGKGKLFEVEIPDGDVLLDEQKPFDEQPKFVQEKLEELFEKNDAIDLLDNVLQLPVNPPELRQTLGFMRLARKNIRASKEAIDVLRDVLDKSASRSDRINAYRALMDEDIVDFDEMTDSYEDDIDNIEASKDYLEDVLSSYENGLKRQKGSYQKLLDSLPEDMNLARMVLSKMRSGREIYLMLSNHLGEDKEASLALNEVGIKGITYVGGRDGRCFVVFDDKAISIIEKFNQQMNEIVKGTTQDVRDGQRIVSLFEEADESTFLHEMGHLFLLDLERLADMSPTSAEELQTVRKWAAWSEGQAEEYKDTPFAAEFAYLDARIRAALKKGDEKKAEKLKRQWEHERFARGFEVYLKHGEAPTKGLRAVFAKFRAFLQRVYQAFTGTGGRATAEVEAVMARMIAMEDSSDLSAYPQGKKTNVYTDSGKKIPVQYRVVSADDLITSHDANALEINPGYPAALQPRDRERVMMRQQVTGMANTLRPEDLADGRNLNQGAPLIRSDGVVLNGNGRTIAIARAQARNKERATAYRDYLVENAALFGFSKDEIENVKNPVLVREVQGDISEGLMQDIISSTTGGARMGASEAAQADAEKITYAMLDAYVPNEKGDLTTAANRNFVAGILHKIVGNGEMNAYLDKDGHVNADGIQRVKRALFACAYGDDELIAKMAESTDDDIRNVSNGMMAAAPMVARLAVKKGVPYVKELQDAISDAVKQLDTLRRSGESVKDYLGAQALFAEHEDSAEMRAILSFLDGNKRSGKRIATFFSRIAKELDEMETPSGNELFDAEIPSLMDVLEGARQYAENGGQDGLFGNDVQEVAEIKKALTNLAREAWSDKKAQGKVSFKPSQKLRDKVQELFGHDIDEVFITADDMRHIKKHHSEYEEKRGQISLTPENIIDVYDVVNDFDEASLEQSDAAGNQKMMVVKDADGRMFALLVERGRSKAEIKTVYKYKKPSLMSDAISPNLNARSDSVKVMKSSPMSDVTSPEPNVRNDSAKVSSTSNIPRTEAEGKQEPTLENILQLAPSLKKAALEYGARDENGKVTFPDEARKQEFIKVAKALLGAGERKTSARRQESLKEMLDGIRLIPPTRVSPRKRVIADWGREMGVSIVFFKGDPSLHGFHQDGVTFLNVDSEITPQWTFWHEAMHWMKANNPDIYNDIVEAISGAEGFTKEQLDTYRKEIGAPDMSDADVIEEMIADALPDVKRRVPLLRNIGKRDTGLVQRVVAWIRDVMRRFHDHFHTPKGGLTSAQRIAMTRAFGNLVGSIRDADGKQIFHIENEGARITLRNGKPLPAVKFSLDNTGKVGDNEGGRNLGEARKEAICSNVLARMKTRVHEMLKQGVPFAEIQKELEDENSTSREEALRVFKTQWNIFNSPRVNKRNIVERITKREDFTDDEVNELFEQYKATMKEMLDYGGFIYKEAAFQQRGNREFLAGVHSWRDLERVNARHGGSAHTGHKNSLNTKHLESQGAFSMPKFSARTKEESPKGNFGRLKEGIRSLVGVKAAENLELPGRVQRTVTLSPKDLEKRIRERWIQEKNIISKEKQKDGKIAVTYYPDTHDVGYADYVKSVRQVAKRNPFVKVLYDLAHKAMKKQEKLRNEFGKSLKEFAELMKNEKDMEKISVILWQGDAEGKAFTDAELRGMGANERVIKAYKLVRRELEKAYKMLRDAQTQVKTRSQTLDPESVESFKKSHWIEDADVISAVPRADGTVLLTWRGGKTYDVKGKTMTAEELKLMQEDENINVTSAMPIQAALDDFRAHAGRGLYKVSYVERIKPVFRRTGYMPHFFHEWMIYEKYKDPKTGEERYTSVASGRTMNEAVKIGNEIAAKNKDKQYALRPKGFDLGTENAVVIGDMDFAQMSRKLAESTEVSLADARSLLLEDAGMSLKSRHRFFGSLLERKDGKGFDQDVQWVLAHYLNGASRYIAMEEFKPAAISMYERFFGRFDDEPKNLTAQYCKNLINDVNGNPRGVEVWLNDLIKKTPIGKYVADSFGDRVALALNGELSTWNAITKLGLGNFASAAVNFSQFLNVGAALNDYGYAMNGLKRALNPSALDEKIIEASGLLDDINMADDNGGYTQRRGGKVRGIYSALKKGGEWTLIPFQKADTLMRKAAVLGAYYQGVEQKGMKTAPGDELSAEALAYAQEINDDANFDYSSANAPNMLRAGSVVTQQLFQFQKYPIMQFEFMYNILKNGTRGQKVRMFVPYVLFCGIGASIPFGALFNQLFSFLFGLATGDDEDVAQEIKAEVLRWAGKDPVKKAIAETALYGFLAPTFGLDISGRIGMSNAFAGEFYGEKPDSISGIVGQQLGGPMAVSAINMLRQAHEGNPIEALKALSPALGNMAQAWAGESRTTRHRVNTRYDTAYDKITHALGFRSVEESNNAFIMNYEYEQKSKLTRTKREAIQDYIADPSDENRRTINALGITEKQIKEARIQQERTALERAREGRSKTSNKSGASRRRKEEAKRETLYDTLDDE